MVVHEALRLRGVFKLSLSLSPSKEIDLAHLIRTSSSTGVLKLIPGCQGADFVVVTLHGSMSHSFHDHIRSFAPFSVT